LKGAHDAEFVCVADHAYIVAEVNDLQASENAGWPFIYTTLSVVNLKTLALEQVIGMSRGEQRFENDTLPMGACFVPRIIVKDASTLRLLLHQRRSWETAVVIASTASITSAGRKPLASRA
jgi:hypothetical protein